MAAIRRTWAKLWPRSCSIPKLSTRMPSRSNAARVAGGRNVPARLHRADVIGDVFGGARPLHAALAHFKKEGRGVIVYLRDGSAGVPVTQLPQGEGGTEAARSRQWREVGLGAQILKDLGISSIRLMASAKFTYVGLAGFGIEITDTETTDA